MNNLFFLMLFFNVLFFIIIIYGYFKYRTLFRAYDTFMRGKTAESLESLLENSLQKISFLEEEDKLNKQFMREINKNHRASFQKLGFVKYNAFKGLGGNLSFAFALLDYTNSGFIFNSVHSNEGCFNYIKTIDRGQSDIILGQEEKEALEKALGYRKKH